MDQLIPNDVCVFVYRKIPEIVRIQVQTIKFKKYEIKVDVVKMY